MMRRSPLRRATENGEALEGEVRAEDSDTFLSGIYPTDKLQPVVMMVLYFGEKPWDGPLSLEEMFSEEDRQFLRYSGNFHINLVTVKDIAEQEGHSESEFWLLMNALHIMNQEKPDLILIPN